MEEVISARFQHQFHESRTEEAGQRLQRLKRQVDGRAGIAWHRRRILQVA